MIALLPGRARTVGRIAALAALIGAGACTPRLQPPVIDIVRVRVTHLGLTAGEARISFQVANPNSRGVRLHRVDYAVDVAESVDPEEWILLGEGVTAADIVLPAEDTVDVEVELPFSYRAVGAAVRSLLTAGEVGYRIRGLASVEGRLGRVNIPFESTGRLAADSLPYR